MESMNDRVVSGYCCLTVLACLLFWVAIATTLVVVLSIM